MCSRCDLGLTSKAICYNQLYEKYVYLNRIKIITSLILAWERLPSLDCYAGRGGDPIQPDPYSNSMSLRDCKAACGSDSSCQGIIRKSSDGEAPGVCYRRRNLVISNCVGTLSGNYIRTQILEVTSSLLFSLQ